MKSKNLFAFFLGIVALVILALGLVLFRQDLLPSQNESPLPGQSIAGVDVLAAGDQPVAETVNISEVTLSKAGYILIRQFRDGQPGAVIGVSSLLPIGNHTNWIVQLYDKDGKQPYQLQVNDKLFVGLYADDGDGIYNEPDFQSPIKDSEGSEVSHILTLQ